MSKTRKPKFTPASEHFDARPQLAKKVTRPVHTYSYIPFVSRPKTYHNRFNRIGAWPMPSQAQIDALTSEQREQMVTLINNHVAFSDAYAQVGGWS